MAPAKRRTDLDALAESAPPHGLRWSPGRGENPFTSQGTSSVSTIADVHRDFEAETHLGEIGLGPHGPDLQNGFSICFILPARHAPTLFQNATPVPSSTSPLRLDGLSMIHGVTAIGTLVDSEHSGTFVGEITDMNQLDWLK